MTHALPDAISIRLASPDEANFIANLSRDYIEEGLVWTWTAERVERAIAGTQINVAVASKESDLIGFGIMSYVDSIAHLMLLAVRDGYRRNGIGTAVVHWLEKVARTAGIESVRVEARADNTSALSMYAALGYRERARVPGMYSGIEDGIRLEKVLSEQARLGI